MWPFISSNMPLKKHQKGVNLLKMWWANKHGIIAFLKSLYKLISNLNNNLLKQKVFLYVLKISIIFMLFMIEFIFFLFTKTKIYELIFNYYSLLNTLNNLLILQHNIIQWMLKLILNLNMFLQTLNISLSILLKMSSLNLYLLKLRIKFSHSSIIQMVNLSIISKQIIANLSSFHWIISQ